MNDEIKLFAELRPTEPHLTPGERAAVHAAAFASSGATTLRRTHPEPRTGFHDEKAQRSSDVRTHGVEADVPRKPRRRALTMAAGFVLAVGLGGIWLLASNRDGQFDSLAQVPGSTSSTPATTTTVRSAPVAFVAFGYQVSSYEGTDVITPTSIDELEVCFTVEFFGTDGGGCADSETISSGRAWGWYGGPDGGGVLVGVVPDAVDTVEVDGQPVDIVGNVWSARLASAPSELLVGDTTTDRWVKNPLGLQSPSVPTTTVSITDDTGPSVATTD